MDDTVSVLLPVHAGVDPAHLREAVESVLAQTRPADEVVVVEDGPLDDAHTTVLDALDRDHPRVVRVRLRVNGGAGVANQAGLEAATSTWIAKADADDVNLPHRLATQLVAVRAAGLDVCGSAMLEFEGASTDVVAERIPPLTGAAIARRMRWNNPFNHPTTLFRRDLALAVGGYPTLRLFQDYVLFARLERGGAVMANLAEPLVLFRSGDALRARRSSPTARRLERELQGELHALGLVSRPRMLANRAWRGLYRRLPSRAMRLVERRALSAGVRPAGVVTRQVRFGWRTVRDVARDRRVARELPRLLATRGRSTMTLRLPWLPFRVIDDLAAVVGPGTRVLEYGGGGSTLWFLDRGAEVVTVEHDAAWADRLAAAVDATADRWTLLRRPLTAGGEEYVGAVAEFPGGYFDVVVVDGRERARCVAAGRRGVRPGGLMVVDDTDRPRYRAALAAVPWPRRDVVGFAPAKPTLAYTTVLRRPQSRPSENADSRSWRE